MPFCHHVYTINRLSILIQFFRNIPFTYHTFSSPSVSSSEITYHSAHLWLLGESRAPGKNHKAIGRTCKLHIAPKVSIDPKLCCGASAQFITGLLCPLLDEAALSETEGPRGNPSMDSGAKINCLAMSQFSTKLHIHPFKLSSEYVTGVLNNEAKSTIPLCTKILMNLTFCTNVLCI